MAAEYVPPLVHMNYVKDIAEGIFCIVSGLYRDVKGNYSFLRRAAEIYEPPVKFILKPFCKLILYLLHYHVLVLADVAYFKLRYCFQTYAPTYIRTALTPVYNRVDRYFGGFHTFAVVAREDGHKRAISYAAHKLLVALYGSRAETILLQMGGQN